SGYQNFYERPDRFAMQRAREFNEFEDRFMGEMPYENRRGFYSPSENFDYVAYEFNSFGRPHVIPQENYPDDYYREGWQGDTGYTSAYGGHNTGWDDDYWNIEDDGESMGW